MIRIAVTAEAFDAVERFPGNVGFEREAREKWRAPDLARTARRRQA